MREERWTRNENRPLKVQMIEMLTSEEHKLIKVLASFSLRVRAIGKEDFVLIENE